MKDNIITILKKENRTIKYILQEVSHTHDPNLKRVHFRELKKILVFHMAREEKTIYRHASTNLIDDHHRIKDFLQLLNLMDIESSIWDKTFVKFSNTVLLHGEEEQRLLNELPLKYHSEEWQRTS